MFSLLPWKGSTPMSSRTALPHEELLEWFFSQSQDGFFFMMLDEPVEWGEHVDKGEVMDFVFDHQRLTKVNPAFVAQYHASSPGELLGMTPAKFFAHDLIGGLGARFLLLRRGLGAPLVSAGRADPEAPVGVGVLGAALGTGR